LTWRCEHPDVDGGYNAASALLSAQPSLDGLVCHNDLVAIGALRACAERGLRIPDDVAVTGADDILLARLVTPALTTLRSDRRAIGAEALRMLLDRLQGGHNGSSKLPPEPVIFQPELVVRASAPSTTQVSRPRP
jgi:LacI family transcriptional regulator